MSYEPKLQRVVKYGRDRNDTSFEVKALVETKKGEDEDFYFQEEAWGWGDTPQTAETHALGELVRLLRGKRKAIERQEQSALQRIAVLKLFRVTKAEKAKALKIRSLQQKLRKLEAK